MKGILQDLAIELSLILAILPLMHDKKKLSGSEQDLFDPFPALCGEVILPVSYPSSAKIHIMNLFLSVIHLCIIANVLLRIKNFTKLSFYFGIL